MGEAGHREGEAETLRGEGDRGTECGKSSKGTLQEKEGSGGMGRGQRGVEGLRFQHCWGQGRTKMWAYTLTSRQSGL